MIRGNEADKSNVPHAQPSQVSLQSQIPGQPMQGLPRVAGANTNVLATSPSTIAAQPATFQQYMIPGQIISTNQSGQPSVRTMVAVTQTQAVHNYLLTSQSCVQGQTQPVATLCTTVGQQAISSGASSIQLTEGVSTTLLNVPVVTTQVQQVQVQMPLTSSGSLQDPLLRTQIGTVCAASTIASSVSRPIEDFRKSYRVTLPVLEDVLAHTDPTHLHSYTSQLTSVSQTGGTIHHHSTSPTRRMVPPLAGASLAGGSVMVPLPAQQQRRSSMGTVAVPVGTTCVNSNLKPGVTTMANLLMNPSGPVTQASPVSSPVQRPKRIKLEEKPPANEEVAKFRKMICDHKIKILNRNKENYVEHVTELFFLQHNGNMMDFLAWKRRPSPQLMTYLRANALDSDDEEQSINTEVKVPIPGGTPVAISTTLPAAVTQLTQHGSGPIPGKPQGGRHGMVFGNHQPQTPSNPQPLVPGGTPLVPELQASALAKSPLPSSSHQTPPRIASSPQTPATEPKLLTSTPITSTPRTSLAVTLSTSSVTTTMTPTSVKSHRLAMTSVSPVRLQTRQHSISAVYDSTIGSQEEIVERAKQEAFVVQRISELRKDGLWSEKRLPKVQEPPRTKAHWDYLLEEMVWLATDFAQERKWKKAAAKKCARMCQKFHQEQKLREERAEKEAEQKLKRIASAVAKEIKQFWANVEKLVEYKQQSRLEEKRKKALDLHLNFIVDQTEKYSSWLAQGINKSLLESTTTSIVSSVHESRASSPARSGKSSSGDDVDFEPNSSDSDDEETIAKEEEQGLGESDHVNEVEMLQKDGEVPLEDLLETLPPEILEKPATPAPTDDEETHEEDERDTNVRPDEEFRLSSDESVDDDEATMEEQEEVEGDTVNHTQELDELREEGEMSLEDLLQKYTSSNLDYEGSESSSNNGHTDDEQDDSDEETEEETNSEDESVRQSEMGIESLLGPVKSEPVDTIKSEGQEGDDGPTKEITDIAADAERFQPKGYTYSTAQVATTVPFLLKHQLREYQHIGLDWLVTMQERKLNGILADEMGLGKTIQTIALLAHLACEKGIWGPHLIVVPTSVMLNWEMECKKWCPAFKILTYYGTQKERKQKRQGWTKPNAFHICITSYKLVIQDHQSFRRKRWKYFILDEAQNIKNFKSQRWQLLLNFQSQWRLLLTGTPLQNSLMELWSLMHFLMPNVFQSHRDFKEWFANPLSGMIEGSHEYNESLIRRLHKVLRPFLLRRLKSEVEKQLPQKYEHVIMCRLSKRQRFLYDDFMSQAKTKETLANGNFMSVINVLMQLRKVCNHPNMFEARPTISPFQMEGICFWTASIINSIFEYDPYKHVNLYSLNLLLSDLELCLTAFAAHRIKRFQTPKKLIEEIDSAPDPPPKCPPGKIKLHVRTSTAASQGQSGRASPLVPAQQRATSPAPIRTLTPVVSHVAGTQVKTILNAPTLNQHGIPVSVATTQPQQLSGYTFQLVQQQPQGLPVAQLTPTSTPITVQIQQTQQGPRITVPAGQLAQIPAGFAQIVQTSTGQHILLTSNPQAILQPVSTIQSTPGTGLTLTTANTTQIAANSALLSTPSSVTPTSATAATPAKSVAAVASTMNKPVLRVPPMNVVTTSSMTAGVGPNNKPATLQSPIKSITRTETRLEVEKEPERSSNHYTKSIFFLDSIVQKKKELRAQKLRMLAKFNTRRCEACPIYGSDLIKALTVVEDVIPVRKSWRGMGYIHCMNAVNLRAHPSYYWYQSDALGRIVKTPEQCIQELRDVMNRFVFLVPPVTAPRLSFHTSHPSPSPFLAERQRELRLQQALSPLTTILHPISSAMATQFPDPRLIEYDCGKLQTLVYLLRRLKSESHRVLIFTQMTRMLDVLEQFLNYHGHIYLRLDGTTRVEQRQALMERFNADKRIFVFILSTRSGGIGVNLTGADTVIFYDSDWNPTMDAQAQDRCHRIGQTRDVHIYRLVSMKSIEENILKKANQKRLLGEVAIEGGNFTTAFFRKTTIHDLFSVDFSDMRKLDEDVIKEEAAADNISTVQLENALANAEEEQDVQATKTAKAEAAAELAEFDESIPYDADGRGDEEVSKVEQELGDLMSQLTPVERYAMVFLESIQEPFSLEQLKQAEEEIEAQKKDWELGRLQALKEEEEERRAQMEEDEVPFTYSREDANNQVHKSKKLKNRLKINNSSEVTPGRRSSRISTSKRRSSSSRRQSSNNCEEHDENKVNGDAEKNDLSLTLTNHTGDKDVDDPSKSHIKNALVDVKGNSPEAISIIIPNDHGVKGRIGLRSPATSPKQGSLLSPRGSPRLSPASNSSNSNCGPQGSPQPFSNPNLVIRTRRASAREAQHSGVRHDSEGEVDVVNVCTELPSTNCIGVNSVGDHSPLKSDSLTPDRVIRRVKVAQESNLLDGDSTECQE